VQALQDCFISHAMVGKAGRYIASENAPGAWEQSGGTRPISELAGEPYGLGGKEDTERTWAVVVQIA
jgi:hypothetical protein